ncbi:dGTP triphosphohydrolase [Comamonas guangdongensis]|uniref:dGTP triphosphohydrolase n=1 Tax=Comamonas guangdongensis TaxID=510515 RepID=A0ABV3ZXB6_9BURK
MSWINILNSDRRKNGKSDQHPDELRTELERDYDRILFSTPVRRLADKTQVFPLDRNDSVRNRLTHSHEVSNLARSLGVIIATKHADNVINGIRDIPAVLAAVGLVHDLGNPPFGHQGEAAIRKWFANREKIFLSEFDAKDKYLFDDFLKFDGNAQTLRLVTRLQMLNDNYGIDLTYATLAALMKYTVGTDCIDKSVACKKKHGFFHSEAEIAKNIFNKVGLSIGTRHPLAYVMEACDDIAYATIDVEDCVKKGLASFNDVMGFMRNHYPHDSIIQEIVEKSSEKYNEYLKADLSPHELNDISIQRFRVFVISQFIKSVVKVISDKYDDLMSGSLNSSLIEISDSADLRECLGKITKQYAFKNRSVLQLELKGFNTITELMDIFWFAIKNAQVVQGGLDKSEHPYARYVYSRISENYRRVFENPTEEDKKLPLEYRRCLLLTDMMSGMTDSYAMNILDELKQYKTHDLSLA